jgi:hypothetical protein
VTTLFNIFPVSPLSPPTKKMKNWIIHGDTQEGIWNKSEKKIVKMLNSIVTKLEHKKRPVLLYTYIRIRISLLKNKSVIILCILFVFKF